MVHPSNLPKSRKIYQVDPLLKSSSGWHSRGYLPHLDFGASNQFVTFRLFDSLPAKLLSCIKEELSRHSPANLEIEYQKKIEQWLDRGVGGCYLQDPRIADVVEQTLFYFDSKRYNLRSWIIMPNHCHAVFTLFPNCSLAKLMHSLKSYSSLRANQILGRSGLFWGKDYFDRFIRDDNHLQAVVRYVEYNPVTAGLCMSRHEWRYGSAWYRAKQIVDRP